MKTVCILAVVIVCVTVCMGKVRENKPQEKQNSDAVSKREVCKDKWFSWICKFVNKIGRCNSSKGKERCAKTCGHCGKPQDPCADIYPKPKCLYLQETNKCYTDEARENCGTTCEACGKACKNYHKECSNPKILDELCTIKEGGFMLCPRGCNLCIDRE